MIVNYEKMLRDSNQMKNYIKTEVASLSDTQLMLKPAAKKWSAIEVVEHLNKVYDIYLDKFLQAIDAAEKLPAGEHTSMKRTFLGRLSTYAVKPKNRKRRFKVKTFDFFRPAIAPDNIHGVIDTFLANKETFNQLMEKAKMKDLNDIKVSTAIGEKVRFYIPECFEFLLAHEERHVIQIQEVLLKTVR